MPSAVSDRAHRRALEAFLARHHAALSDRARRLCRQSVDAEDLVQDALERATRAFHQVRDEAAGRAWLFAILHNLFVDRVRVQQSAPTLEAINDERIVGPDAGDPPPWSNLTPDDLRAAVARLPERLRRSYCAHYFEGKDYATIAREIGIPRNTVGTRLLRARRQLRVFLCPDAAPEDRLAAS